MRLAAVALQLALLAFAAQHACADPFTPDALAGSHADQKQPGSGLQARRSAHRRSLMQGRGDGGVMEELVWDDGWTDTADTSGDWGRAEEEEEEVEAVKEKKGSATKKSPSPPPPPSEEEEEEEEEDEEETGSGSGSKGGSGGIGSWESGGSTGIILIHASLMKDGKVYGFSNKNQGVQEYGSVVYNPSSKSYSQLLDNCGLHGCKNAFCGAQVVTGDNQLVILGGHAKDCQYFRQYSPAGDSLQVGLMSSARWYPGVGTLADGKLLIVGGSGKSGDAGYHAQERPENDNPTYEVYDPESRTFGGDQSGMRAQLSAAFPIGTYPQVVLLPDGGVAVSAGKLLVKYSRSGDTFTKEFDYPSRPGAPWSYPQTGMGVVLPISPPWTKVELMAAGGSSSDRAGQKTPASSAAQVIDLTSSGASWRSVASMPQSRIMGDGIILCDGSVGFFNGAGVGVAGWGKQSRTVTFKDGSTWDCPNRCSKADDPRYSPALYDPQDGSWSSGAEAQRPRLYHSIALLLPDCRVMVAGSDVTWDQTAEIYSPPYLSKGPRPSISSAPGSLSPGDTFSVGYSSADPVTKALLLRAGSQTHSMAFDQRALWLDISSSSGSSLDLATPSNPAVLPPGLYMLTLISSKGVPSQAKIMSVA